MLLTLRYTVHVRCVVAGSARLNRARRLDPVWIQTVWIQIWSVSGVWIQMSGTHLKCLVWIQVWFVRVWKRLEAFLTDLQKTTQNHAQADQVASCHQKPAQGARWGGETVHPRSDSFLA